MYEMRADLLRNGPKLGLRRRGGHGAAVAMANTSSETSTRRSRVAAKFLNKLEQEASNELNQLVRGHKNFLRGAPAPRFRTLTVSITPVALGGPCPPRET